VTASAIIWCVVAQLFLVAGQLFFKHAMNEKVASSRAQRAKRLAVGIVCQAVWFFLWLGLLEKWDLSRLFPFEGLNPLLLVLAAWLILHERLTLTTWLGVGLITGGLVLVAI
jgi:drug/metabolite transporter (DMT)-like permease